MGLFFFSGLRPAWLGLLVIIGLFGGYCGTGAGIALHWVEVLDWAFIPLFPRLRGWDGLTKRGLGFREVKEADSDSTRQAGHRRA